MLKLELFNFFNLPRCIWLLNHAPSGVLVQLWELVDVLHAVLAVGHAEAKVKVERLEMSATKAFV